MIILQYIDTETHRRDKEWCLVLYECQFFLINKGNGSRQFIIKQKEKEIGVCVCGRLKKRKEKKRRRHLDFSSG